MQFMLFAVNKPAQEPQPGQPDFSMQSSSAASIFPASNSPAASNMVLTLTSRLSYRPASIGPPLTTTDGILSRAADISIAGVILSQFVTITKPSSPWPIVIASTESVISSRLGSGYFIPS